MEPYKIETHNDLAARSVANHIRSLGGQAMCRGSAVLTKHQFTEQDAEPVKHYIGHTTGWLSPSDEDRWDEFSAKTCEPCQEFAGVG